MSAPGAAGGIGQPLALLLKMNPLVGALSLYDVVATPGVGADLGHINTGAPVCFCSVPEHAPPQRLARIQLEPERRRCVDLVCALILIKRQRTLRGGCGAGRS